MTERSESDGVGGEIDFSNLTISRFACLESTNYERTFPRRSWKGSSFEIVDSQESRNEFWGLLREVCESRRYSVSNSETLNSGKLQLFVFFENENDALICKLTHKG